MSLDLEWKLLQKSWPALILLPQKCPKYLAEESAIKIHGMIEKNIQSDNPFVTYYEYGAAKDSCWMLIIHVFNLKTVLMY